MKITFPKLDFPFVKSLRVKEATIRILNSTNEADLSDTESLYFNSRPGSKTANDDEDNEGTEQDTYDVLHMSRRGSRLPESETTVVEEFSVQQCDSDTNVDGYENEIDDFENYSKIFGSSKKPVSISVNKLAVSEDRTEEVSAVDPKPGA